MQLIYEGFGKLFEESTTVICIDIPDQKKLYLLFLASITMLNEKYAIIYIKKYGPPLETHYFVLYRYHRLN